MPNFILLFLHKHTDPTMSYYTSEMKTKFIKLSTKTLKMPKLWLTLKVDRYQRIAELDDIANEEGESAWELFAQQQAGWI